MSVTKKPKPSPLAIAKAASGSRKPAKTWLDNLDKETRVEIIAAAKQIWSGKLTNKIAIVNAWRKAGIDVTYNRLNGLIRKINDGAI